VVVAGTATVPLSCAIQARGETAEVKRHGPVKAGPPCHNPALVLVMSAPVPLAVVGVIGVQSLHHTFDRTPAFGRFAKTIL